MTQFRNVTVETDLINSERLWSSVMEIAQIGAIPDHGSCRLSLTDEDKAARDLFAKWCKDAGLQLRVDAYGNMFATRYGLDNSAPHILIGSHLDTQPHGGRFDGVLGVLAGLEILRSLDDAKIRCPNPITVVNWTNEEGVRFKPGLTGSAGFVGDLDRATVAGKDSDFFEELKRIGYAGELFNLNIGSYYELHIEQGPVLEREGVPIGIVEGIQGVRWYEVHLHGQDAHAGTTPSVDRKDSFMAAAALALRLRSEALSMDSDLRFTVGTIEISPNSTNTVPGHARLVFDVRHRDIKILDAFEERIKFAVDGIVRQEHVTGSVKRIMDVPPAIFDEGMQDRLRNSAQRLGIRPHSLPSGAMHDASSLSRHYPTAMIFVQSRDGISHNPAEWSDPEHVKAACAVLAHAILSQSGITL
jgi:beta-ureidopropionase / N-carbamoyl-L-amino-acid hydrolase